MLSMSIIGDVRLKIASELMAMTKTASMISVNLEISRK